MSKKPVASFRRLPLYFALALCGCVVLAVVGWIGAHTRIRIPFPWFGLLCFTALVFWTVATSLKTHWRRAAFWFAMGALLVLHFLAFAVILRRYPQWRLVWFVPASLLEAGLFVPILEKLCERPRS